MRLELAQYRVSPGAGAACPRQTDLVARLADDRYLIEVKHQARPADIDVVESLRARLQRTGPRMIGVVIGRSGFTATALRDTEEHRAGPVLLIGGEDIDRVAADPDHLRDLLEQQYEDLVTHGRRNPDRGGALPRTARATTERTPIVLVDLDGRPQPWLTCAGGYDAAINALELHDIDWTPTPASASPSTSVCPARTNRRWLPSSTDGGRRLNLSGGRCSLSMQFPGVPLDTRPLLSMLDLLGVSSYGHFRPRSDRAVETWRPSTRAGPKIEASGYVIEPGEGAAIVRGVQARNPFIRGRDDGVPEELRVTSHLILTLRSWHAWGNRPAAYRL